MSPDEQIESQTQFQWRRGIFNHLEFGISEEELHERISIERFDKDWRERSLAINRSSDGAIHIASVPSGKGIDIIWGMKFSVTLYPDGHYYISTLASWIGEIKDHEKLDRLPQMAPPHFKMPWED